MEEKLIGREKECKILLECMESDRAEFVAVYGRRRVGKTFLIKRFFSDTFDFYTAGIYGGSITDQLRLFYSQINSYADGIYPLAKSWAEAFDQLKHYITNLNKDKIVLFFDELPWMDSPRSKFVQALEVFWNMFASTRKNVKLIVCGSATTWMVSKLIGNKGGLHNRLTHSIHLSPFTLKETEDYLKSRGMSWERDQIMECYMALGGTPYYLSMLQRGKSAFQNIDDLFFGHQAPLKQEYSFLFRSLFNDSGKYKNVVELLAKNGRGMTRKEIQKSLKFPEGGQLTKILDNLISCDFVRKYSGFGKKERDVVFQLCDFYTLFYLRFVSGYNGEDDSYWSKMIDDPSRRAWSGYAFEQVCFSHINQIKKALGISGIISSVYSWIGGNEEQKAQIDMIIDRRDGVMNICEIKYSSVPYEITKTYYQHIVERRELFRTVTATKKSLLLTFITMEGLKANSYSSSIPIVLTADDLFE